MHAHAGLLSHIGADFESFENWVCLFSLGMKSGRGRHLRSRPFNWCRTFWVMTSPALQ